MWTLKRETTPLWVIGGIALALGLLVMPQTVQSKPGKAWQTHIPERVQLPEKALQGLYFANDLVLKKTGRLLLPIPGDEQLELSGRMGAAQPNGARVWRGMVDDDPQSSAIITQFGSAIAGVVRHQGRVFKIQGLNDRVNLLVEVDPREPYPEFEPQVADTYTYAGSSSAPATDQASDDGTQIDVMVVYSTATRERLNGTDQVNAYIATAIAETNDAYVRSGIGTQLRLVHTAEVENSSGDMGQDLSNLRSSGDGILDEVHTLRDAYGADMVSWFNEAPNYCGIAYLNTGNISLDAGWGFSVVKSGCAVGYYTTAHELGHNMGSHHDYATASPSQGIYTYSYGYQDPNANFRTVMAYNCPGGCARIRNFSNPSVTFRISDGAGGTVELPTGTAAADNARSINLTRTGVAQWRTAVVGAPPVADFMVSCDLLSCQFSNRSSSADPIESYLWDFGDGTSSNVASPTHQYTAPGIYTVTLRIVDSSNATAIDSQQIEVVDEVPMAPVPPSDWAIEASGHSTSQAVLTWGAVEGADVYVITRERAHKNGRWTGTTSISTTQTTLSDQPGEGRYRYRVLARNSVGDSLPTDFVEVTLSGSDGSGGGTKGGGKGRKK